MACQRFRGRAATRPCPDGSAEHIHGLYAFRVRGRPIRSASEAMGDRAHRCPMDPPHGFAADQNGGCVVVGFVEGQPGRGHSRQSWIPRGNSLAAGVPRPVPSCTFKTLRLCSMGRRYVGGRRHRPAPPVPMAPRASLPWAPVRWVAPLVEDLSRQHPRVGPPTSNRWTETGSSWPPGRWTCSGSFPEGSLASCRTLGNADQTLQSLEKTPTEGSWSMAGRFFHRPGWTEVAFLMNFDAQRPCRVRPHRVRDYVETDPLIQCHLPLSGTRPVVSTNESPACISRRGQSHETDRCAATPCILTCDPRRGAIRSRLSRNGPASRGGRPVRPVAVGHLGLRRRHAGAGHCGQPHLECFRVAVIGR